MLPVMKTRHAAAMERFLPRVSDTVPATNPPAAATRLSDDTITPCRESDKDHHVHTGFPHVLRRLGRWARRKGREEREGLRRCVC